MPSVDHLGKKYFKIYQAHYIFAFEIFEIAQKTKKLALLSYPLGSRVRFIEVKTKSMSQNDL